MPTRRCSVINGEVTIDADILAAALGRTTQDVRQAMIAGTLTSRCETGVGDDAGRYRVTFFEQSRRLQLIVADDGTVSQQSLLNYGNKPLPAAARRPSS